MTAGVAVDSRKSLARIAAGDGAFDDLLLDATPHAARLAQLSRMALRALPKRARAQIARAITAHRRPRAPAAT